MDFKEKICQLSERTAHIKNGLHTEESTKFALVIPMLLALGYDVFNPMEVSQNLIKQGEKPDFAIFLDGQTAMLVKCTHWKRELTIHDFHVLKRLFDSEVKCCLLTNGITYRFYLEDKSSDIEEEKPFLELYLDGPNPLVPEHLKMFRKENFNVNVLQNYAFEIKCRRELGELIQQEFSAPSPEFAALIAKRIFNGVLTSDIQEQFSCYLKEAIAEYVNNAVQKKFHVGLSAKKPEDSKDNAEDNYLPNAEIIASADEIEGYMIVRRILHTGVDVTRIGYRDMINSFTILLDDDDRRPLCRLYLSGRKSVGLFNSDGQEEKHPVTALNDLYGYSDRLEVTLRRYLLHEDVKTQ